VLGHSAFELERLARQERLIGPSTHEYFQAPELRQACECSMLEAAQALLPFSRPN
jgi:hypothetical protein